MALRAWDPEVELHERKSASMRVLLITGSFPPMRCGVGDYTYHLALALARDSQLTVAVLTSTAATRLGLHQGIVVLPVVKAWAWKEIRTILDAIRQWAPDVVHIQYPTMGYGPKRLPSLLPLVLRLAGFAIVQTWHELESLKNLMTYGLLMRFASRALVPGGLVIVRRDFQQRTDWLLRWAFLNKTIRFIPNASAVPTVDLSSSERNAVREQYARPNAHVIAYFGFIYPRKRVELLFQIADPSDSHLVIIGDGFREEDLRHFLRSVLEENANYHRRLKQLAEGERWRRKVTMTGFLPNQEAARVLAAADAVVLPVLGGGGGWNTSVHAAQAQGTFVLTTSGERHGYDAIEHTYFAGEHDLDDMRRALRQYMGKRADKRIATARAWQSISKSHTDLYLTQVAKKTKVALEGTDDRVA